jgi:Tol biopolymer transport system component
MRVALVLLAVVLLAVTAPAVATFPGRNGELAFYAYSVSEESSDFVIDGTWVGIAKVPGGPRHIFARGLDPAFSPAGRRLAYAKRYPNSGIWLTRPDCRWPDDASDPLACSRLRRLTRGAFDHSPAWSPDGKRIAFVRLGHLIYTVRASGGGLRFVARGADPDWSSAGVLAFTASGERGIRLRDPSGGVRTLTATGADPSWAPAGDRLAFTGEYDSAAGGFTLWTIKADGTGLRRLWAGRGDVEPVSPTWSPDGRWIAFIKSFSGYGRSVWVVRPSGRGLRMLTPPLPDCRSCFKGLNFGSIAWQPLR